MTFCKLFYNKLSLQAMRRYGLSLKKQMDGHPQSAVSDGLFKVLAVILRIYRLSFSCATWKFSSHAGKSQ